MVNYPGLAWGRQLSIKKVANIQALDLINFSNINLIEQGIALVTRVDQIKISWIYELDPEHTNGPNLPIFESFKL